MRIPNPAAIIVRTLETDPVTEVVDETIMTRYGFDAEAQNPGDAAQPDAPTFSNAIQWREGDGESGHSVTLQSAERIGDEIHGSNSAGQSVVIRPLRSEDAVDMAPMLGIRQPLAAVNAEVLRGGGMLATSVEAVVAPDNSVPTLVLETGVGMFVRYGSDWNLLPENSQSLDGMAFHDVDPATIDVFDAADASGQTLTIFDLPRVVSGVHVDVSDREKSLPLSPVTASLKKTATRDDLDSASVIASAAYFLRAVDDGHDPDPLGAFRRDLIKRARRAGLLAHPTIVAAINWKNWLHPRGRDGRFIETDAIVKVFDGPGDSGERLGKVKKFNADGVTVEIFDPVTDRVLDTELIQANQIQQFKPLADLDHDPSLEGDEVDTESVESMAEAIVERAKAMEGQIGTMLKGAVGELGMFYGWEHRFKLPETVAGKIRRWVDDNEYDNIESAAKNLNDTLRYSVLFPNETYIRDTKNVLDKLESDPNVADLVVYNAWENQRTPYNGINVEVRMKNGMIFEMQFHTPTSQVVKNQQHKVYSVKRTLPKDSPEAAVLEQKMHDMWKGVLRPPNVLDPSSGIVSRWG